MPTHLHSFPALPRSLGLYLVTLALSLLDNHTYDSISLNVQRILLAPMARTCWTWDVSLLSQREHTSLQDHPAAYKTMSATLIEGGLSSHRLLVFKY